ncbi:hypothetical protein [Gracilibacillus boraciitolerans]|nr:hypothetical protein [Gracilibacillus boraciitolerans]
MDVYLDNNAYKFVTVRYNDLKEGKNEYYFGKEAYEKNLNEKNISSIATFKFSLYKNDLLILNSEKFRLIGVNNDKLNRIELNTVEFDYKEYCDKHSIANKRIVKTISRNTNDFNKLSTDTLGNQYIVSNEKWKNTFQK